MLSPNWFQTNLISHCQAAHGVSSSSVCSMLNFVSLKLNISMCLRHSVYSNPWTHHAPSHIMWLPIILILGYSSLASNYSCSWMLAALVSAWSRSSHLILGKQNSGLVSKEGLLLFCLEHVLIGYHLEMSKSHFGASSHCITYWSPKS